MNDFGFITNLAGVANRIAAETVELLDASDRELLRLIRNELKGLSFRPTAAVEKRLIEIEKQVREIRDRAIKKATENLMENAIEVGSAASSRAAATLSLLTDQSLKTTSESAMEQLAKRQPFGGNTIQQWFKNLADADTSRIMQQVRQGLTTGTSVETIVRTIRGTKEYNYSDGILQTSRRSAVTLARTTINGMANNARLKTFVDNADVIDGLKFVATLDHRTSQLCAYYDGKIWKKHEWDKIVVPPLHPACRSTIVAWIEGMDDVGERPAERENFDDLAKDEYEQRTGKNWDDLSDTTRKGYRYKEMRRYEDETGKSAYKQVSAREDFRSFFDKQSADFQRSWLGVTRYEAFKDGSLTLDDLISPDTRFTRTVSDLKALGKIDAPRDAAKSAEKHLDDITRFLRDL